MLLFTWGCSGELERWDDTLNGPQVSEGARGLKLWLSVSSTIPYLVSSANTVQYEQYEPQHRSLGYRACYWTLVTTRATLYQSLSPAVQPVFKPSSSLSSPHLIVWESASKPFLKSSCIARLSPHVQEWSSRGKTILNVHDTALLSFICLLVIC